MYFRFCGRRYVRTVVRSRQRKIRVERLRVFCRPPTATQRTGKDELLDVGLEHEKQGVHDTKCRGQRVQPQRTAEATWRSWSPQTDVS